MDKEIMFEYIQRLKLAVITLSNGYLLGCMWLFYWFCRCCISPDAWLCRQPAR